ncbi:MAG: ATP-binding cassette domain-containing protein [Mycobacterium sp.]|nr:MAG: ATP-binding cassette domain-containing protein [Mycobacterium sp.]
MDGNADPMIRLAQVSKQYGDGTVAVHDLDLEIGLGEICALVGPSGCGKTTTMRMINRLVEPTTGHVYVGGEDVTQMDVKELRRHIGYVIQAVGLFPHYTVRRNIGTVCSLLGWDKARTAARADELLDLVGLDPSVYGDRYPHQLSGGQRQRVGVARALAADPPVLLMDEPFGAVDPIARDNLQEQFLALHAEVRKTVVLVTHDIDEAVRMADRIAVMRQGGYLEQYAPPAELLAHPVNDFVADFVGADRTLKRLAVTPLPVLPDGAPAGLPAIAADASLAEALTALLESPAGQIAVGVDGEARLLTLADVHSALRDAA